MTFYVLGNGFYLHYGMPTKYYHFKSYFIANGYQEIVDKVDHLFDRYGQCTSKEIKEWSTFEDMLTELDIGIVLLGM